MTHFALRSVTVPLSLLSFLAIVALPPRVHAQCPADFVFAPPSTFQSPYQFRAGVVQDFNADGALDAVLNPWNGGPIFVFWGLRSSNGPTGTLLGPAQVGGGSNFDAIAAGDFNSDGIQDVAASTNGGVTVFLGRTAEIAAASFAGPDQSSNLFTGHSADAASADLNSDGILDLAVSGEFQGGSIVVLLGNGQPPTGNGSFRLGAVYGLGLSSSGVAIADLNADGILDIASIRTGTPGFVSVFLGQGINGQGDGTFGTPVDFPAGPGSYDVVASDLNGDGLADLAIANAALSGGVTVMISESTDPPGPVAFSAPISLAAGPVSYQLSASDFNGDGIPDLAVATSNGVALLIGHPAPGPSPISFDPPALHAVAGDYIFVGAGDLNGDGRQDVIAAGLEFLESGSYVYIVSTLLNDCVSPSEAAPTLHSIRDVPLDQGGRVKVSWLPSAYDRALDARVNEYWIWRSVSTMEAAGALTTGAGRLLADGWVPSVQAGRLFTFRQAAGTDSFWEFVASQPASALQGYSYIARTPYDSTGMGNPMTPFFIQARTSGGAHWFSSEVVGGYSVDNIPPRRVQGLAARLSPPSLTIIHWRPNPDEDLSHYAVYKGADGDFVPGPENRLAETSDTTAVDPDFDVSTHYTVLAVDIHGNESEPVHLGPKQVTGVDLAGAPPVSYLRQNFPNPFNPETVIEFGLRAEGLVSVRIYDATGRLVRVLVAENRPAGAQSVRWDGRDSRGRALSSGVYVARLTAPDASRVIKMALMR